MGSSCLSQIPNYVSEHIITEIKVIIHCSHLNKENNTFTELPHTHKVTDSGISMKSVKTSHMICTLLICCIQQHDSDCTTGILRCHPKYPLREFETPLLALMPSVV